MDVSLAGWARMLRQIRTSFVGSLGVLGAPELAGVLTGVLAGVLSSSPSLWDLAYASAAA